MRSVAAAATALGLHVLIWPQAVAATQVDQQRVRLAAEPRQIAAFELTDQSAKPFTRDDLLGRTSLVFFGFTHCRSVCPTTITQLRQVVRALADEHTDFTNVFISVDGDRDTPETLSRFLSPYSPGFIGLTGKPRIVRDVATDFQAVFFKGMPTDTQGGYDVEHTPQVYLVDRKGRLRATFYGASVDDMVATTRQVMREK